MKDSSWNIWWMGALAVAAIVYILGLLVPVMDVDAAQYASISRQMFLHHDYLQVHYRNQNYLDKPPLLFWLSSFSFQLFGIHNWSYKLPSFLFTIAGVFATYQLASSLYTKKIASIAALMLATCQAFFLFNNDVRTDTLLTGSVAVSTWQLYLFYKNGKTIHAFFGFTFIALGMLAKGPLGAAVPALALLSQITYERNWKSLIRWQWYAGVIWILILLVPMLYGLYEQYNWYGVQFFFWYQSFGRITGQNSWHNDAGYFFFVHTFLWAFLPWSLFAVIALWNQLRFLFQTKFRKQATIEVMTCGGFLLSFIALSFSHYKLPHYIFNLFPLAAIFTAAQFENILNRLRFISVIQWIVLCLLWICLLSLIIYFFPLTDPISWFAVLLLLAYFIFLFIYGRNERGFAVLFASCCTVLVINLSLNGWIYPQLLKYQSGSDVAWFMQNHQIDPGLVKTFNYDPNSLEYYSGHWMDTASASEIQNQVNTASYFIGRADLLDLLKEKNISYQIIYQTPDFAITRLTFSFLFPVSRQTSLKVVYVVQVN